MSLDSTLAPDLLPPHLLPPMANGEVIFEAPWQSRIFGMAVALSEQGMFAWSDFQASLIEAVAEWENANPDGADYPYFEVFQTALLNLLVVGGSLSEADVDIAARQIADLPHGHDHQHHHE